MAKVGSYLMYNKVLKRPMFNMGGRINQAAGTGITSGLDTPKRGLVDGPGGYAGLKTREDIAAEIETLYPEKTPGQNAIDILSSYEVFNTSNRRADGTKKSYGDYTEQRQKAFNEKKEKEKNIRDKSKLALLDADMAAIVAEESFQNQKTLAEIQGNNMLKQQPFQRRVEKTAGNILAAALPNSFESIYSYEMSTGINMITDLQTGSKSVIRAAVVPSRHYTFDKKTNNWVLEMSELSPSLIYFEPTSKQWLIVDTKGAPTFKNSYEQAFEAQKIIGSNKSDTISTEKKINKELTGNVNEDADIKAARIEIVSNLKDVVLTDAVVQDEAAKAGIKIVSRADYGNSKAWLSKLGENEMTLQQFKDLLQAKKISDIRETQKISARFGNNKIIESETTKVVSKADGGRVNYALGSPEPQGEVTDIDSDIDELNELQSWWKTQVDQDFNS